MSDEFRKRLAEPTPRNVRAAMIFGGVTTAAIGVIAFLIGRWTAPELTFEDPISCQFQRIAGRFDVHPREMTRDAKMMLVTRGDREFMFRREDLYACGNFEADDDPSLPEPINGTRLESLQEDDNE